MNGQEVIQRRGNTIFIRLPRELWRECGICRCDHCKGAIGYWDAVAVAIKKPKKNSDTTWTVHMPDPWNTGADPKK